MGSQETQVLTSGGASFWVQSVHVIYLHVSSPMLIWYYLVESAQVQDWPSTPTSISSSVRMCWQVVMAVQAQAPLTKELANRMETNSHRYA
mgnify:CR=1 FL=1